MNCPICSNSSVAIQGYEKVFLHKCSGCGVRFCGQQPTEEEIENIYNSGYDLTSYFSPITKKRYEELTQEFESFRQTNNLLDVGCGYGFLLDVARENNWEVQGNEISSKAIAVLGTKNIPVFESLKEIQDESMDVIVLIETIEHLIDPKAKLKLIHQKLRKGGALYITTPNFNSLNRRRLGVKYDVISYPLHLFYFTKNSLNQLLLQEGFDKKYLRTTGFSKTRLLTSRKRSNQEYVSETSNDEMLRYRIENSESLTLLKKATNFTLNLFGLGESIKALYVKR